MVRYAKESEKVINAVADAVRRFEKGDIQFFPVIARDESIVDTLNNPLACLLACRYGIAIFDSVTGKPEINPNVAYELGFMHLLQRKCLLLKQSSLASLHTDVLHKLYEPYKSPTEAGKLVTSWLGRQVTA